MQVPPIAQEVANGVVVGLAVFSVTMIVVLLFYWYRLDKSAKAEIAAYCELLDAIFNRHESEAQSEQPNEVVADVTDTAKICDVQEEEKDE